MSINVPRELNYLVPSRVYQRPVRLQQRRYRHVRVPVAVRNRALVRRTIQVGLLSSPSHFYPVVSQLRSGVLTHFSHRKTSSMLAGERHVRRYKEKKNRRGRAFDGQLNSVRRDVLLGSNTRDVRKLGDAALVQRAVFGD